MTSAIVTEEVEAMDKATPELTDRFSRLNAVQEFFIYSIFLRCGLDKPLFGDTSDVVMKRLNSELGLLQSMNF
jgi:hypothetical protein